MLWENVRELNRQGMTIVLTTHYLEEAQDMCDEIAIINHGEVIARDRTERLLSRLDGKTLVIRAEGDVPALDLPAGVTQDARADGSISFSYSRSRTGPGAILGALQAACVTIADVTTEEPDLEDVFVALTSSRAA